jgi:hypothetical protein
MFTERPLVCAKALETISPLQLGPHGRGRRGSLELGEAGGGDGQGRGGGGELWLTSDPFAAEEGSRAAPASSDGGRAVAERPSRHEIWQSPKQGWAMSGGGSSSVP